MTNCLRSAILVGLASMVSGSCAGRDEQPGDPGGPFPPLEYRTCPLDRRVGEFRVELGERFTAVSGSIAEAVVPLDVRELVEEAGDCRLFRKRLLACVGGCSSGMTCGEGGRCIDYPDNLDAGMVTMSGLLRPVKMEPDPAGRRYWDTNLPHPGFTPGANIHLRAAGAALAPFSLSGWGVTPLSLAEGGPLLEPGQPLVFTWAPGPAGPARVEITLSIDQHGVTPSTLVCETPDVGRFEIAADQVSKLLAAGASGYPKALLSRQTVDAVTLTPGCVELIVSSPISRSLTVSGHTPCRIHSDCPPDRRCNLSTESCL